MGLVWIYELGLVVCTAVGWLLGRVLFRFEVRNDELDEHGSSTGGFDRLTDTLTFVSGVFGILLGLLLFFAVQHFTETQAAANEEAMHYAAVFDTAEAFPADVRTAVQRDTVCVLRSLATDSWASAERGDRTGDENTIAWQERTRADINSVVASSPVESNNHAVALDRFTAGAESTEQRVLHATSDLPPAVWFVIFVSMFAFATILTLSLMPRTRLTLIVLTACTLLTMAVCAALVQFTRPFDPTGATVRPHAIETVLLRLEDTNPGPIWEPCEVLAASRSG